MSDTGPARLNARASVRRSSPRPAATSDSRRHRQSWSGETVIRLVTRSMPEPTAPIVVVHAEFGRRMPAASFQTGQTAA